MSAQRTTDPKVAAMHSAKVTALFSRLPEDATNEEALQWAARIRRVLLRWEELPAQQTQMMTPELAAEVISEIDELERIVHREMRTMRQA